MLRTGFLLAAALLLCFASASAETRLMVVSDLHYLAPSLYADSQLFEQVLRTGDGKVTQYGEELMAALVAEVAHQRPDALLVTGDLTYNGEELSHLALAAWFAQIEAIGVPVWVLPGNHDINTTPSRYEKYSLSDTDSVDATTFGSIYADDLGTVWQSEAGFTCAVDVGENLRLIIADVALYEDQAWANSIFTAAHEALVNSLMADADGRVIVTASHHNLFAHSEWMLESYQMAGWQRLLRLMQQNGAALHLSGHLHLQHIVNTENTADAATGAFCLTPHRYALVTVTNDGHVRYSAHALCDDHLPEGFQAMSRDWFTACATHRLRRYLAETDIPAADQEEMLRYAAEFNLAYFGGTLCELSPDDAGALLWQQYDSGRFARYMQTIAQETVDGRSMLIWSEDTAEQSP